MVKNVNTHNVWAARMIVCEILTFLNVLANIYYIDLFLGGEFSTYGLQVTEFSDRKSKKCCSCFSFLLCQNIE